jgi:hypothetical protein
MKIIGWTLMAESWSDLPCEFAVDPKDPFAILASFGGVEWRIARELLQVGLSRPTGQGDVRIWPTHGAVASLFIHLRTPGGEALVEMPRGPMRDFLAALPPAGIPDDVMDAELRRILDGDKRGDGVS